MNAPERLVAQLPQRLDFHDVARLLPYGAPWLLIDRVLSWDSKQIVVCKAVSGGEVNMSAHLRDGPSIMPGVLHIELVNQATMLLMILLNSSGQRNDSSDGAGVLARVKANFLSPAYIGELITATVKITAIKDNMTFYEGNVFAGDRAVSRVEAIGALVPNPAAVALAA